MSRGIAFGVGLALLGGLAVLITELSPGCDFVQTYGPNAAVALFELSVAVGVIQWFVERERAKEREPIERQAVTHAGSVIRSASTLVRVPIATFREAEGAQGASDEDMLKRYPDLFLRLDLAADAAVYPPRPLGAFLADTRRELDRTYSVTADTIATYCPRELALAVQKLFEGGGAFLLFCSVCEIAQMTGTPYPNRSAATGAHFRAFFADVERAQTILAEVKQRVGWAQASP